MHPPLCFHQVGPLCAIRVGLTFVLKIFSDHIRLKISRLPAYGKLLKLGKERKGAIFLDIGCCCKCFRVTFIEEHHSQRMRLPSWERREESCR